METSPSYGTLYAVDSAQCSRAPKYLFLAWPPVTPTIRSQFDRLERVTMEERRPSFKNRGFSISGTINPATGGSGATLTLGGTANATTLQTAWVLYIAGLGMGVSIVPSHLGFTFYPSGSPKHDGLRGLTLQG